MNYVLLLFPAIMWGTLGAFVRLISMSSTQIALIRTILAAITLLFLYLLGKKRISHALLRKNLPKLAAAGIAMAFNWIALFEAYKLTSVSVATVVYYLAPAIVIAASPFLFQERLTPHKIGGLCAALVGMACVSFSAGVGEISFLGIATAFGGALLYATVILCNKSITGMSGLDTTLVEFFFAILILLPYSFLIVQDSWYLPTRVECLALGVIGIFHTGICYWMYFSAVQRVKAQTTAICSFADPFSALFVSFFLLNEALSPLQILGAVLIIGGAMVSELYSGSSL